MSDVKMCDNCGELFSVNQENWRQSSEQWNGDDESKRVFNNAHNHGMVTRHVGPCCAGSGGAVTPRVARAELEK